jgi:hypothetical protein
MAQQAIVRPRPAPPARPRKPPTRTAPAAVAKEAASAGKQTKATTAREATRIKETAATQAKQVKSTAAGQTRVVKNTAQQDVRQLAGTVRSQADQVKGELTGQVKGMLAETQGQLQAQADVQAGRVASALWQVGSQAVALSQGRPEQAGPLVDYAEQAATWLDNAASHIEERGIEGLATDVVDFARRRPAVFLAGAAVVGFGVGRLIRSGAVSGGNDGEMPALEAPVMGELEA